MGADGCSTVPSVGENVRRNVGATVGLFVGASVAGKSKEGVGAVVPLVDGNGVSTVTVGNGVGSVLTMIPEDRH